ncbi:MAG TPA: hypothetical protein VF861_06625, partial [Telluria sp.]
MAWVLALAVFVFAFASGRHAGSDFARHRFSAALTRAALAAPSGALGKAAALVRVAGDFIRAGPG